MKEYIILSRGDIITLCKDEPVKIEIDKRPLFLCSDEYFEKQKAEAEIQQTLDVDWSDSLYHALRIIDKHISRK